MSKQYFSDDELTTAAIEAIKQDRRRKRKRKKIITLLLIVVMLIGIFAAVKGLAGLISNRIEARAVKQHEEALEEARNTAHTWKGCEEWDGDSELVEVARTQLGNVGGDYFGEWAGFDYHVEWCAVFVSWVADQCGCLGTKVPDFALVQDGVNWYQAEGKWGEPGEYEPEAGDIIFFSSSHDGYGTHVGIVASVKDGRVYTIEGNTGWREPLTMEVRDEIDGFTGVCMRNGYDLDYEDILGYGIVD